METKRVSNGYIDAVCGGEEVGEEKVGVGLAYVAAL